MHREPVRKKTTGEPGNGGQFGTTPKAASGVTLDQSTPTSSHANSEGSAVILAVRHDTSHDPLGPLPPRPESLDGADIDFEFDEYEHTVKFTVTRANGAPLEVDGHLPTGMPDSELTGDERAWLNRYQRRVGKALYALMAETKSDQTRRAILDAAARETPSAAA